MCSIMSHSIGLPRCYAHEACYVYDLRSHDLPNMLSVLSARRRTDIHLPTASFVHVLAIYTPGLRRYDDCIMRNILLCR